MPQTYRVRFTPEPTGLGRPKNVSTVDLQCEMDQLLGQLPIGAYVLYIEDLTEGRDVHWTRWPKAFRPGSKNETTGRVMT
ncbi:hypothetical protein [Fimbriiglobus ruber]|uniref:Uncharacterized protein n=1 Tax=Fimbriiglobus ruber TaxID=1908690 RepID=A0A225DPL4_9BACT|nr:hypothetical protein [Fimbriiglobus ruber]OWK43023.1 hypothetical protein FRUB_02622 [Fimbriiglobus ruber]